MFQLSKINGEIIFWIISVDWLFTPLWHRKISMKIFRENFHVLFNLLVITVDSSILQLSSDSSDSFSVSLMGTSFLSCTVCILMNKHIFCCALSNFLHIVNSWFPMLHLCTFLFKKIIWGIPYMQQGTQSDTRHYRTFMYVCIHLLRSWHSWSPRAISRFITL